MFIDCLGIPHTGIVYVPDDSVLEECFKVRVLTVVKDGKYKVLGEELYPKFPTEDQIKWCIVHYKGSQAVVEKVYWLEKIPFAEGGIGECLDNDTIG